MAVQFPQRTIQEQTEAYRSYAANTLFPYTYSTGNLVFPGSGSAHSVTKTDPSGYSYLTYAFQADNNLAIYGFHLNLFSNITSASISTNLLFNYIELSYSPIPLGGTATGPAVVNAVPTIPSDVGNIIFYFGWVLSAGTLVIQDDIYERFTPSNYLLKYNQFLYFHIGTQAQSTGAADGSVFAKLNLHTLPTGLKI